MKQKNEEVHDKYYEGFLQLRNCEKEIYDFVYNEFDQNGIYIADQKQQKNGVDFKVSSNKFLLKLGDDLSKKYSGVKKISRKLFSQDSDTGKPIYRMTVKFEQLPFRVGDTIEHRGDEVKVQSISGDKINVKDLKTGKRFFIKK
ncbi:hypothetical protein KY334_08125 [Candidatus Woesearchaeota archaeon]|nr:hypothetical protein [Candidatus Woesearchaeota archaeon]